MKRKRSSCSHSMHCFLSSLALEKHSLVIQVVDDNPRLHFETDSEFLRYFQNQLSPSLLNSSISHQIPGSRWNDSLEITEQPSDVPSINVTKASPKLPMRMESMDI